MVLYESVISIEGSGRKVLSFSSSDSDERIGRLSGRTMKFELIWGSVTDDSVCILGEIIKHDSVVG